MISVSDDIDLLRLLEADPRFQQLATYVPDLSFFNLTGHTRAEIPHSRVIATLFDPRRHRQAEVGLRVFLEHLAVDAIVEKSLGRKLLLVASSPWTTVRIRRELFRIDVVIEVLSPAAHLVIGIENKIDAGEQPEQLARYQAALDAAYPDCTAVLVFLAPSRRLPLTAVATSKVTCVALDYTAIIAAVQASLDHAPPSSPDAHVLRDLRRHLKEDILADDETRQIVRELWMKHGRALALALEHRPRIKDVLVAYERRLRERLGKDAEFEHYPTRGELREIKVTLRSWLDAGFPFTFMFYADPGERPQVRLLLWSGSFETRKTALKAWAQRVNKVLGHRLDDTFAPIGEWKAWRRVFREEDYPSDAAVEACNFDDETASEAADRVFRIVDMLHSHIDGAGPDVPTEIAAPSR
jgi:PD-(D/E)XK nuclease superfamily